MVLTSLCRSLPQGLRNSLKSLQVVLKLYRDFLVSSIKGHKVPLSSLVVVAYFSLRSQEVDVQQNHKVLAQEYRVVRGRGHLEVDGQATFPNLDFHSWYLP